MRAVDVIRQVRDGEPIPSQDLKSFVNGIASGEVPDYQAAAFLMAVYHRGLSEEATVALTLAMRDSGEVITHPKVKAAKVDKHSTGGVGDKISLALAPWVAACDVPVPMVSGRGLGHTGGTLDKLESIKGFRVDLDIPTFQGLVADLGCGLIGQTATLAPADRKLYALRDVTATIESIPLITASILSKKLAEGIDALVLDVKVGRGAFMKTLDDARALAKSLVSVGAGAGLKIRALLTRMDEPLGLTIGNALEAREAIDILHGRGPDDTTELTLALGAEMLVLGDKAKSLGDGRAQLLAAQKSGAAAAKFVEIINAQGGDAKVVEDTSRLPQAPHTTTLKAPKAGTLHAIDSYALGMAAMKLGAGRARAEDDVDPAVGLELLVKVGAKVEAGAPLCVVHHRQKDLGPAIAEEILGGYEISADSGSTKGPIVLEAMGSL